MGGGRWSPPHHPSSSGVGRGVGSGRLLEDRSSRGIGGKKVDGGSRLGVVSGKNGGSSGGSDRRFSLAGLEGLAKIGAEEKRLVYVRSPGRSRGAKADCSISLDRDEGQNVISSVELDGDSNVVMVD